MGQSNPQPGDEYRSKNNTEVYEVKKVDDEFVILEHTHYDQFKEVPHNIFDKGYVEV